MEEETTLEDKQGCYTLSKSGDIAILRLGKDFLLESIDLSGANRLFEVIELISQSKEIKVLVVLNCPKKIGSEEYIDFCRQAIKAEVDRKSIHRLCNIFDRLIIEIASLNKLVIHADCGEIIPVFLNISLACDYRIVSAHTTFQKPYFQLGMLPTGGGVFFLCNLLGYSKTKQLLMSEKEIGAAEAFEIGFVDQVVPDDKLEETAIQTAQDWTRQSTRSLLGIKKLLNYTIKDLTDYLDFESDAVLSTIGAF
ncbi:MAG: enoyl-CoA hydratase/isomerase family protein [Desulfobacteraceae bacterium]|jgi:2-(1,2-epoxy-1,2-dihydrophenyl)acetyl-CoA isomerase|nr:enoyl-CoA hydratase/isomerase family protein [Desulfobacteraceae bacterium]